MTLWVFSVLVNVGDDGETFYANDGGEDKGNECSSGPVLGPDYWLAYCCFLLMLLWISSDQFYVQFRCIIHLRYSDSGML